MGQYVGLTLSPMLNRQFSNRFLRSKMLPLHNMQIPDYYNN